MKLRVFILKVANSGPQLSFYEHNAITVAHCQEHRDHIRLFFGLHLYLAGKYCKNPKVPGAQLNVNPARTITWLVGVTIYCTFFNNNSPPPRQCWCNKILLKKISYSKGNVHWTNFWIEGAWAPGRICTLITGCFQDKTIISKKNLRLDCYLMPKYYRRQCTLLTLPGSSHLQNLTLKCKIWTRFGLKLQAKGGLNSEHPKFFDWLSNGSEYVRNVI